MKDRLNIADRSLFISFLILVFFVPLVFLGRAYQSYTLPDITILQLTLAFMTVVWLSKNLLSSSIIIRQNSLNALVFFFLILVLLSTVFSISPGVSILGTFSRNEGLIAFLIYGLTFFAAFQFKWDAKAIEVVAHVLVISATINALYGLAQYFGYDFIPAAARQIRRP